MATKITKAQLEANNTELQSANQALTRDLAAMQQQLRELQERQQEREQPATPERLPSNLLVQVVTITRKLEVKTTSSGGQAVTFGGVFTTLDRNGQRISGQWKNFKAYKDAAQAVIANHESHDRASLVRISAFEQNWINRDGGAVTEWVVTHFEPLHFEKKAPVRPAFQDEPQIEEVLF